MVGRIGGELSLAELQDSMPFVLEVELGRDLAEDADAVVHDDHADEHRRALDVDGGDRAP